MTIILNGESRELEASTKLVQVVRALTGSGVTRGVAVAINGELVPAARWSDVLLRAGDEVEVLHAIAGG